MKRAISPRCVASWLCCIGFVNLSATALGQQTFPPLTPVNVSRFSIPFEIGESAHAIREVELFFSQDRGKRWQLVARQPVESGKFAFRADVDGEYWFAFRTGTPAGTPTSTPSFPELRVLVDTRNPVMVPSPQPSESGPIVPPKPERFRTANNAQKPQPTQLTNTETATSEQESQRAPESERARIERNLVEKPDQILAPRFPGVASTESEKNREGDLLDDLLSSMSPFLDVQPMAKRNISGNQVAGERVNVAPNVPNVANMPRPSMEGPAGRISDIVLSPDTKPQIVVRWNTGDDTWKSAQIDVFRSSVPEGQWSPIAINLPNSGEYWWYLSPEDLKPFYIALRIRSAQGGISVDVTHEKIEISPRLATFQSQRP